MISASAQTVAERALAKPDEDADLPDIPAVEFGRTPNAKINYLSVSQLKSAAPWVEGGCHRKWYLKKVVGLPEPEKGSQALGKIVHAELEHYMLTGEDVLGPIARAALPYLPTPKLAFGIEHSITKANKPEIVGARLTADGIPLVGFIDRIDGHTRSPKVVDYKTSKDPAKWAPPEDAYGECVALATTETAAGIQMVGYVVAEAPEFPFAEVFEQEHLYLHTKPTKADKDEGRDIVLRKAKITPERARAEWKARIDPLAATLRQVAKAKTLDEVEPNWNACGAFGGCAFEATCITNECRKKNPQPENRPMSLADLLKNRRAKSAQPSNPNASATSDATQKALDAVPTSEIFKALETPAPEPVPKIVPDDAPKSDPAKAAEPMPIPDAEKNPDAEKPKRGRKKAEEPKPDAAEKLIADVQKTLDEGKSGFTLFIDATVTQKGGIATMALASYLAERITDIEKAFPDVIDIRNAPKKGKNAEGKDVDHPLAYGGWKGVLAAECKLNPPKGNVVALGVYGSELMQVAIEALEPMASVVVRGVR